MKQFKGLDWTVADQFTISPHQLTTSLANVKKWFGAMISHIQGSRYQAGSRAQQGQTAKSPAVQASTPQLNETNLHQHEQQEEALQRAKRANLQSAPPAPTTAAAPSPQGVPHAYGPTSLTQDKLNLPPPKRRKQNQSASKTASATASNVAPTNAPEEPKLPPAEANKPAPVINMPFKCTTTDCQYSVKGFASQPALDNHIEEVHKVEAPIENALEYALESYRFGLGVDREDSEDAGKQLLGKTNSQNQPLKSNVTLNIKQETSTPNITNGTVTEPMGRVSSHGRMKPASPGSIQAKTPAGKGAQLPNIKRNESKDSKASNKPGDLATSMNELAAKRDSWSKSRVSLEAIRSTFDLSDQPELGLGPFLSEDMAASEMYNFRTKDTPQSTDTAPTLQTPDDSDISKDDEFNVNHNAYDDGSWIPTDWINLPGQLEGGLLMQEPWEEINWDSVYENEMTGEADGQDTTMVTF